MEEEEKWKVVRVKRGANREKGVPGGKASHTYPPSSGRFGVLGLAEQEPKAAAPVPPAPSPVPIPPASSNSNKAKGNEKRGGNPPKPVDAAPKAAASQQQSKGVAAPLSSVKALANKKKAPAQEEAPPPPPHAAPSVAARPQEANTVDRPQPSAPFLVRLFWGILTLGGLLTAIAALARGLFGPRTLPDRPQSQAGASPEPAAAAVGTEAQLPTSTAHTDDSSSKTHKGKVEEKEQRGTEGPTAGDSRPAPAPGPAAPPKGPKPAPPPPRWKSLGTDGDWAAAGSPSVGGRSWRLVRHEELHTEHVTGLAVHGTDLLASVGWDTKAAIYRVSPGGALTPVKALSGHTARVEVVLSLPGSDLLVTAGRDAQLLVWRVPLEDPESAARVQRHYLYEGVRCAALSPSHPTQLFLGTQSGLIIHFDAAEGGRVLGKVQAHGEVTALAAHPTIPGLLFSAGSPDAESDPEIRAWVALLSGKFETRGEAFGAGILRGRVHSLLSTKDGLYAGDFSGAVKVWLEGAVEGTAISAPRTLPVVPVGCGAVAPLAGLAYCAERRVLVTSAAGWYASNDSFEEAPDDEPETTAALNLLASSGSAAAAEVPLYTCLLGRGLVTSLAVDEARARLFVGTTSGSVAVLHLGTPGGQGDVRAPVRELGLETLEELE